MSRSIGYRIRAIRTERGFSQAEIGRRMGVNRGYIWKIEADRKVPSLDWIARIAKVLCVRPVQIDDRFR